MTGLGLGEQVGYERSAVNLNASQPLIHCCKAAVVINASNPITTDALGQIGSRGFHPTQQRRSLILRPAESGEVYGAA
jgi:hypothetical protein